MAITRSCDTCHAPIAPTEDAKHGITVDACGQRWHLTPVNAGRRDVCRPCLLGAIAAQAQPEPKVVPIGRKGVARVQ